jgi:Carboxypeptidase regulatory-like domain/Bacterial Ig-like domain (group 2)
MQQTASTRIPVNSIHVEQVRIMRAIAVGLSLATVLVSAGLFAACDNDRGPTGPSSQPPSGSTATINRLEISGPGSVPPGESVQFRAMASMSDGSTRDVSQEVQWFSSSRTVLSVSSTGLATGANRGESVITIRRNPLGAGKTVMVLPNGTYRLTGFVTEAGAPANPVAGARVEVPSGVAAGLGMTTDFDGRYRLYGVPGEAQIRVSRDGYISQDESFQLTDHTTRNFQLPLARARPDISGTYTLKMSVAGGCTGARPLPDDLRERTYTAALSQNGQEVIARLIGGGDFAVNSIGKGNSFRGRVDPAGVTFSILSGDLYYYPYYGPSFYPDVVERLPGETYLSVGGTVTSTFTSWGLSGTLNGFFVTYDSRFPRSPNTLSSCNSTGHGFLLAR